MDSNEKIALKAEIFKKLSDEISVNAIQRKDFGQKSDGYNIGYLIDRLNYTLIPYGWKWDLVILPIQTGDNPPQTFLLETFKFGDKSKTTVSIRLKITISDNENNVVWEKESFGGCQLLNNSLGDTLKGAQTDGMKKALSYLGIGNAAFKGTVHDQLRGFSYFRKDAIAKIINYMTKELKMENVTKEAGVKFISSIVKKEYDSIDDILYSDWCIVLDFVTIEDATTKNTAKKPATKPKPKASPKESVKNESENGSGQDKAEATKK